MLNVVAMVVMVPVAVAQRRAGKALGNPVLVAQSTETWTSNLLSMAVLAGLGLNAALGWWWADPGGPALEVAGSPPDPAAGARVRKPANISPNTIPGRDERPALLLDAPPGAQAGYGGSAAERT